MSFFHIECFVLLHYNFRSVRAVPNMAVSRSFLILSFLSIFFRQLLNDFETFPVAPIFIGITFVFTFHLHSISIIIIIIIIIIIMNRSPSNAPLVNQIYNCRFYENNYKHTVILFLMWQVPYPPCPSGVVSSETLNPRAKWSGVHSLLTRRFVALSLVPHATAVCQQFEVWISCNKCLRNESVSHKNTSVSIQYKAIRWMVCRKITAIHCENYIRKYK